MPPIVLTDKPLLIRLIILGILAVLKARQASLKLLPLGFGVKLLVFADDIFWSCDPSLRVRLVETEG